MLVRVVERRWREGFLHQTKPVTCSQSSQRSASSSAVWVAASHFRWQCSVFVVNSQHSRMFQIWAPAYITTSLTMSGQNEMLSKAEDIADKVSLGDICSFSVMSKLASRITINCRKPKYIPRYFLLSKPSHCWCFIYSHRTLSIKLFSNFSISDLNPWNAPALDWLQTPS